GLVHVAVGPDLVARVPDTRRLREMVLHRPARDEEGGAQLQPVEQAQDAVHAHPRPEAALLQVAEAALGLLRLAEVEAGLGVEVEGQHRRGLLAVGPAIAHRDLQVGGGQAAPARGSSTSRRPSPSRFKPSTVSMMVRPGNTDTWGATRRKSRALLNMGPTPGWAAGRRGRGSRGTPR